ncbi:MAG TPA: PQQ-binding-like beta-propeller repeat protein [Bryobacteraceae bacterium]|nr:PQQ-binding-like beta-propeller repeat protein [Bryobacteraceae bacterium]
MAVQIPGATQRFRNSNFQFCKARIAAATAVIFISLPIAAQSQQTSKGNPDWRMYNGDYTADRFSSLQQITRENVSSLTQAGKYQLPETTSFQAGPVVIGDKMFVTTATTTYAINATTGALLWAHKYPAKSLGLGTPVRGVAYADGRLYRGTPDAHLIALDANTGKLIWDVAAGDPAKGDYFTAAPVVWDGRLYVGNSGSDVGTIGRVMAVALKDGHKIWSFDAVPSSGPGSETWPADPNKKRAGGGMYSSFALDTSAGYLYVPTGNPGPDFAGSYRPGKNLYTCSVLMLDAKTGALHSYHQFTPNDVHDWDIAASPVLFTSKAGRNMVAVASKNGYLYGLDRNLSKVAYQVPVTTIANTDAPLTPAGTRFCPGTQGGVNWYGPAYSPQQNALFVNSIDWCTVIKLGGPESLQFKPGTPFLGSSNQFGDSDPKNKTGWLTAVDADTGKVLWKYHDSQPMVAAITPTASGVVFTADLAGNLLAFDAASGKVLLRNKAGGPVGGGVVTYMVNGKQYVAVAAG